LSSAARRERGSSRLQTVDSFRRVPGDAKAVSASVDSSEGSVVSDAIVADGDSSSAGDVVRG